MITINYTIPIYIRMTPADLEIDLPPDCYIIDSGNDNNFVSYQTLTTFYDIADFVMLDDAVEYVKLKIDSLFS